MKEGPYHMLILRGKESVSLGVAWGSRKWKEPCGLGERKGCPRELTGLVNGPFTGTSSSGERRQQV